MLVSTDFTGQYYLGQDSSIYMVQQINNYIEMREPQMWIDLLTGDGYKVYQNGLQTDVDFTDLEEQIKPAFVRLMYFELIQNQPYLKSGNGIVVNKMDNATHSTNLSLLTMTYNDGVRIWNETIDWLNEDQAEVEIYSSTYKRVINVFGI